MLTNIALFCLAFGVLYLLLSTRAKASSYRNMLTLILLLITLALAVQLNRTSDTLLLICELPM